MSEKSQKLKEKVQKEFPEFADSLNALSVESLEKNLLSYAKYKEEVLVSQASDEALQQSKDTTKLLNEPYKEALAALKMKTAYLNLLIDEKKGGA